MSDTVVILSIGRLDSYCCGNVCSYYTKSKPLNMTFMDRNTEVSFKSLQLVGSKPAIINSVSVRIWEFNQICLGKSFKILRSFMVTYINLLS